MTNRCFDPKLSVELEKAGFRGNEFAWNEEYGRPIVVPTLSELIENCGRRDFKLRRTYDARMDEVFYVIEIPGGHDMERCNTPEEALAWFWLTLHKKPE